MNRIRQSFRRKKEQTLPEASRPHQWQKDEEAVRGGQCSFPVKYLGCVEVEESRGMHVCEDAVKRLRNQGKKKTRAVLWVSADALRVVDESTKDLILDQTIEKVSFCAPDRNYDRAFSYICRDGTTRRWLCHSFMSIKDSGERLSHAVGCAFAACLERKQKREKECGVTATFDNGRTSFVRDGSFRVLSATDQAQREETLRQLEEQKRAGMSNAVPAPRESNLPLGKENVVEQYQMEDEQQHQQGDDAVASTVDNAGLPGHAIPRRHAPIDELVRQGSFRGFPALLQKSSPFKRNLSVRLNELPSTLQRRTDFHLLNKVPEAETSGRTQDQVNNGDGEMPGDSINALCSQISMAFSPEDPFVGVPMSRPAFEPTDLRNIVGTPFTNSVAASRGVLHTGHRRTQSEAERWLEQVSKSTQGPVPFPSASASPSAVFLPQPPQFSFQQASVVAAGVQNGTMTQATPVASSVVGPPASHVTARPFGTAAAKATRNVQLSALSLPFAGGRKGTTTLANGTVGTSDAKFEAQWASLENRHRHAIAPPSPRATPSPTNPFCSDVQKTFEIRI